jgi:hypothetical protein
MRIFYSSTADQSMLDEALPGGDNISTTVFVQTEPIKRSDYSSQVNLKGNSLNDSKFTPAYFDGKADSFASVKPSSIYSSNFEFKTDLFSPGSQNYLKFDNPQEFSFQTSDYNKNIPPKQFPKTTKSKKMAKNIRQSNQKTVQNSLDQALPINIQIKDEPKESKKTIQK